MTRATIPTTKAQCNALADRLADIVAGQMTRLGTESERRDCQDVLDQVRAILDALPAITETMAYMTDTINTGSGILTMKDTRDALKALGIT